MLDGVVRVNMNSLQVRVDKLPEKYRMLSGRALTSRVICDEVDPAEDPLGPGNRLILACGLLAGTALSSASRLSAGAKSPLTGCIKESNAGGMAAFRMARLGLRAIIVEGAPPGDRKYVLVVDSKGPRLEDGAEISMAGVYEKASGIYKKYGERVAAAMIGPAGERLQLSAGIAVNDPGGNPGRYCGRGGLGAVMGSKGLLAVILDDSGVNAEKPVRPGDFHSRVNEIARWIKENPLTAEVYSKYGTAAMLNNTNELGALPTNNFSRGKFEGAGKIDGYAVYNTIVSRGGMGTPTHACMPGCLIRCSNIFPDRDGGMLVSPLEYETIAMVGSNCGIDDLDVIARINYLCNDYGIDTIEVGCALAVVMESGLMPFGDAEAAVRAVEEAGGDSLLGRIIASGAVSAGRVLGVKRVPAVKGQGIPGYDPRVIKGTGVTYITSPMGADHTAGSTARANVKHHVKDGQVELSKMAQTWCSLLDYLGICIFMGTAIKDRGILAELVSHRFGRDVTLESLLETAGQTIEIEREFNHKAGFTPAHDRLPRFFYNEPNPDTGSVFDIHQGELQK
ncbi:MAG: aldehyde ferredoxin oxidoreductase C-terminal domain-containing protein [Bacillota bacterium]